MSDADRRIVEILLTDQCGDMVKRRILPLHIFFEDQWMLKAHDVHTDSEHTLALKDVQAWLPSELQTAPY
jgi:hypothetical protein